MSAFSIQGYYYQNTIDEILRAVRMRRDWIEVDFLPTAEDMNIGGQFRIIRKVATVFDSIAQEATDFLALHACSIWLVDGPKIFAPSPEQERALSNIEVGISPADYCQPFPAISIQFNSSPFSHCICYYDAGRICLNLCAHKKVDSIVSNILRMSNMRMDDIIKQFDDTVSGDGVEAEAARCFRVAVNACLALTNFGCKKQWLLPHDVARDQRFAKEKSERGERAKKRLSIAIEKVTFSQDVKLHDSHGDHDAAQTGSTVSTHWRRGHWRNQPHGPNNSLRKQILIKPVLVRADLFIGDRSNTKATYK